MLTLLIRGFITSVDILPLSRFDPKRYVESPAFPHGQLFHSHLHLRSRSPSRLSQRIEIGAPASNSNFAKALQGMKNIHSSFAAQCPPRSLEAWTSPVAQSGILRIDFITPFLSSDDSLPPVKLDPSHDLDGILQAIMGRSENKYYTEDNRVEYLRMRSEDKVHLCVFKPSLPLQS